MADRHDNFNRAALSTTMNPPSDGLGNYTVQTSGATFGVASSTTQGYCPTPNGFSAATLNSGSGDVDVSLTVDVPGTGCGPMARCSDDNNYLWLRDNGSG